MSEHVAMNFPYRFLRLPGLLLAMAGVVSFPARQSLAEEAKVRATLRGHTGEVCSVTFSPDGKTLASGSKDKTVRLWDVASGKAISILTGHTREINSVAFSVDGRFLASGSSDNAIKLWEVASGKHITTLLGRSFAFLRDGKTLGSVSGENVELWDVASGKNLAALSGYDSKFSGYEGPVTCLALSPDGKSLATGDASPRFHEGGNVILWNVNGKNPPLVIKAHVMRTTAVAFTPNGRYLRSWGMDGVKLWDATTGRSIATISNYSSDGDDSALALSSDGSMIAAATHTYEPLRSRPRKPVVDVQDLDSGRVTSLEEAGTPGGKQALAFSPDGKMLAEACSDKTVRLWDLPAATKARK